VEIHQLIGKGIPVKIQLANGPVLLIHAGVIVELVDRPKRQEIDHEFVSMNGPHPLAESSGSLCEILPQALGITQPQRSRPRSTRVLRRTIFRSRVVDGGAESEVTVDKDVDGSRCPIGARRCAPPRGRGGASSLPASSWRGRSPRVVSSAPGENAGEGVDEDGGDALAFERCEDAYGSRRVEAHGCTRKD
jgi:hypothetical protein